MLISYTKIKNYKYELFDDLEIMTDITGFRVMHELFDLYANGLLMVYAGYHWDGVSGPMIDTDDSMIGGCVHDVGYQMIRLGLIPPHTKGEWDNLLKVLFSSCGMNSFRTWYAHTAVGLFGSSSCKVGDIHIPKILTLEC